MGTLTQSRRAAWSHGHGRLRDDVFRCWATAEGGEVDACLLVGMRTACHPFLGALSSSGGGCMCDNKCLARATWCGQCYENIRARRRNSGHLRFRRGKGGVRDGDGSMGLDKPASASGGSPGGSVAGTGAAGQHFPRISEYCSLESWTDGSPRITASLLVFCEFGMWKVCLNDRALGRSAWATGRTPEDALASLEGHLDRDDVDWRRSKSASGRK
jgi:hypothetical protein